jgi:hypothetical protein
MSTQRSLPFALITVALAACSPSMGQLGERCRAGNQASCDKLVEVARTHKEGSLRVMAVKELKDPATLLQLASEVGVGGKGMDADLLCATALRKIDDQRALARFVSERPSLYATSNQSLCYGVAVERITDPEILHALIATESYHNCCGVGTGDLIKRGLLPPEALLRLTKAMGRKGNSTILLERSRGFVDFHLDQSVLLSIANDADLDELTRAGAIHRLNDIPVLQGLSKDAAIGAFARARLDDLRRKAIVQKALERP